MCQVKVKYYVSHCGMSSHSSVILVDGFSEYLQVGRDECNDFHMHRTFHRAGRTMVLQPNTTQAFRVILAGTLATTGDCTAGSFTLRNVEYNNVVAIGTYAVTLREVTIIFDRTNGKGANRFTNCDLKAGTCISEEFRVNYEGNTASCEYTLLKEMSATTMKGYLYTHSDDSMKLMPPEVLTSKNLTKTKDSTPFDSLPVVVMSEEDGVVLVRKGTIQRCQETLYETNHETIFLTKKRLHGTSEVPLLDRSLSTYFNAK